MFKLNFSAIASDAIPEDSFADDDYENDEGDDEYEEDYENTNKSNTANKTKTKSSRMEIELPKRAESSTKSNQIDQIESTTSSTHTTTVDPQSNKLIRLPAVRSEIVPNGFKGKIEDKRKHNSTSLKNHRNEDETKVNLKPDSYVTITKSVSGSLDNANTTPTDDKKFESTYYTKSSTCGYFTFSCNIVYGSNGRSKICRPKTPTNGKC